MYRLIANIDRLLRGEYTLREDLKAGKISGSTSTLMTAGVLLGILYGFCMGLYAITKAHVSGVPQILATMIKVPLLFLLTLVVTFPSLYVFSALAKSRLHFLETLRLLAASIAVNLAVLASLGPVTAFFTLSTTSYSFMKVLNVLFFGVGGLIGMAFLFKALQVVFADDTEAEVRRGTAPGSKAKRVFMVWLVIYGAVGAQMGWILRPFIGSPDLPFQIFRQRWSNFFVDLLGTLKTLLSD